MDIFNFDPDSGAFIGVSAADESPLEPGVFLIPAFATSIAPPIEVSGKRRVYSNGHWLQLDAPSAESLISEVPNESTDQTVARYEAALDGMLDSIARGYRYGDRTRLALRAAYPNGHRALATAFGTWMDRCNDLAKQLYIDVENGAVTMPTIGEFIAIFPPFESPL